MPFLFSAGEPLLPAHSCIASTVLSVYYVTYINQTARGEVRKSEPCAAVSIKAPSTPHRLQGSTSSHQPAQRPQVYCYTPPTADLRPRTGAPDPVQQHAQACCEPLTSRGASGPRAAAREVVLRSVSRRGRRRSQGGHDRSIMVRTFLPPSAGETYVGGGG